MSKIAVPDALRCAEQHFPQAPEKLAELLKIEVRRSPLSCDGWCIQVGKRSIIRINSQASEVRQRFTLAHELGHLILGIPSVIGESMIDVQSPTNNEEQQVNMLAGEILLPAKIAQDLIPQIPVTAAVVKRIAKRAKVSEVFVARRLASLAEELGLKDGLVIFYKNGLYEWQWSNTIEIDRKFSQELLAQCLTVSPKPARFPREEHRDVIVASILDNPYLDMKTVFLQIVGEEHGLKKLDEEVVKDLEQYLLANAREFQPSLQGCFSSMKSRVEGLSLAEAVKLFNERYLNDTTRWNELLRSRLASSKGQDYIRLRLKAWIKT